MNSTIKITATLKFLLLALLTGCPSSKDAIAPEPVQKVKEGRLRISPDALANIKLTKAEEIDFPETLGLMGKLSPTEDRTTVVPARVAGRIESVTVASGETVKQGQALATLFSPDFVSAKEEYAQSLTQAGTKASGNDFSNLSKLAKKRLQTMGLSESDIQNLAGETTKTEKNLVVRAPRSGALVSKTATVGNQVNAGDTLLWGIFIRKICHE
jgi:Cu(I)/Ag(I) efflux system membrane fusion protein